MRSEAEGTHTNGRARRAPDPAGVAARPRLGRVLVVEDWPDASGWRRVNLAREGSEVLQAANGADGLRHARELSPDLVLLDLMVPQLNGWEVCRRLKQDPATRAIPVIIVTA